MRRPRTLLDRKAIHMALHDLEMVVMNDVAVDAIMETFVTDEEKDPAPQRRRRRSGVDQAWDDLDVIRTCTCGVTFRRATTFGVYDCTKTFPALGARYKHMHTDTPLSDPGEMRVTLLHLLNHSVHVPEAKYILRIVQTPLGPGRFVDLTASYVYVRTHWFA